VNVVKKWEGAFTILMTAFTKDGGTFLPLLISELEKYHE